MNFKEYQLESRKTASYPGMDKLMDYPLMGLMGEFGELCEKFKKTLRDNKGEMSADRVDGVVKEMGDLLWYLFQIYTELKIDFQDNFEVMAIDERCLKSTTCLLASMNCCISDIMVYSLSGNRVLLSLLADPSNTIITCLNHICKLCNTTIEEVMDKNIEKLTSRVERAVIRGEGDNR